MRIGIPLVNFDFPDVPQSVAPTLAKVGFAAELPDLVEQLRPGEDAPGLAAIAASRAKSVAVS
jgi:hypothetical protein